MKQLIEQHFQSTSSGATHVLCCLHLLEPQLTAARGVLNRNTSVRRLALFFTGFHRLQRHHLVIAGMIVPRSGATAYTIETTIHWLKGGIQRRTLGIEVLELFKARILW